MKSSKPKSCFLSLMALFAAVNLAHADALSTISIMAVDPAAPEAGPKAATIYVARNDGDFSKCNSEVETQVK
ncbi:MAG TPA: hypothetical protein VMF52_20355 [Steroidobacteraceae bacterium]|nr:hypothetical protein [Steroidobacteraceae bacterium]